MHTSIRTTLRRRTCGPLAFLLVACLAATPAFAQFGGIDLSRQKNSATLRALFKDACAAANRSTVLLKCPDKDGELQQVALGTVVSADGYILTKASEVVGRASLQVLLEKQGGVTVPTPARVIGVSTPQDLALIKVDAANLTPVVFADTRPPAGWDQQNAGGRGRAGRGGGRGGPGRGPRGAGFGGGPATAPATSAAAPGKLPEGAIPVVVGEWVASANASTSGEPFAVGVISVERRRIAGRNAFLGVALGDATDDGGAKVLQVITGSAAEKAGLKVDDLLLAVNDQDVANRVELIQAIQRFRPGDVVALKLRRGSQEMTLRATLGANTFEEEDEPPMQRLLGGAISGRASDFPAVFQHDTIIRPVDCGGPLVDLEGRVIGINIARAGRTETYALPADVIMPLMEPLKSGKLAPVNANARSPGTQPGDRATTLPGAGE